MRTRCSVLRAYISTVRATVRGPVLVLKPGEELVSCPNCGRRRGPGMGGGGSGPATVWFGVERRSAGAPERGIAMR
jgi:hypothetical protein